LLVAKLIASRRSRAAFDEEVLLLSTWIDSTYCSEERGQRKDADDVRKTGGTYDRQNLEYENSPIP
jgi:hypothetical protein